MIDLKERGQSVFLRVVVLTVHFHLRASTALRAIGERARSVILKAVLSVIYILVISPIGWRKRSKGEIAALHDYRTRGGWYSNQVSTNNREIYRSLPSSRALAALVREKRCDPRVLLIHDLLVPLGPLARPPKDKELSGDLYVMF